MSHSSPQAAGSTTLAPSRDHWWPLADRPILALAILFLVGIWVGSRWPVAPLWIALGLVGALVALSVRRGSAGQAALCVGALALGALLYAYQHRLRADDASLLVADDSAIAVEGFVTAELPSRSDARKLIVAIRRLDVSGEWQPASGKLLARVRNVEGPLEGVGVRCRGRVSLPSSGTNPGQFDYAEALSRRQIGLVLQADSLVKVQAGPAAPGMWLRRQAATLRRGIVQRLRESMPGANADYYTGLLAGIVFGMEVTPVPESTAESFRRTGTIHLLVVSGAQITMIASAVLFCEREG
jgi:competence protein ComEC